MDKKARDSRRILAIIPVYGEVGKITQIINRFQPGVVDEICLVVDSPSPSIRSEIEGSTRTSNVPLKIITNSSRKGIGYAIRQGYEHARAKGFGLIVVMAGNGKDDPREIPRLTEPILKRDYDYVQGSRFLPGGRRVRNPFLRRIFTRLFPIFWTWTTGVRCTDVTNGFRAYKAEILEDPKINVWQDWLNQYQLEYYLHYKVLTLGFRFTERPVSKVYPLERGGYTQISAFKDWWQIIGPIVLLKIGAKA